MESIRIIEKPELISYEMIHDVLKRANESNHNKGFKLRTADLSGAELEERIGPKGKCYVAITGNKVVGTISVRYIKRNSWYAKGEILDYILAGVIPEYQGKHINSALAEKVFEFAFNNGHSIIELDTAEGNTHAIEIYKHQGFRLVNYAAYKGLDHYSVIMAKWIGDCPFSETYCQFRYSVKRFFVRMRYKVGKVKRFGV